MSEKPDGINPLVVELMGQMVNDAHFTTNSLLGYLQPQADKYQILRDAMMTFAAGLDSKRDEARLVDLVRWVGELSDEKARAAIETANHHNSNYYLNAKRDQEWVK